MLDMLAVLENKQTIHETRTDSLLYRLETGSLVQASPELAIVM